MRRPAALFAVSLFLNPTGCDLALGDREPEDDEPEAEAPCVDPDGTGRDVLCYHFGTREHRLIEGSDANPYGEAPFIVATYMEPANTFVVAAGTYFDDAWGGEAFRLFLRIELATAAVGDFMTGEVLRLTFLDSGTAYEADSAHVTITELTESRVKGTFAAWLYDDIGGCCQFGMPIGGSFDVARETSARGFTCSAEIAGADVFCYSAFDDRFYTAERPDPSEPLGYSPDIAPAVAAFREPSTDRLIIAVGSGYAAAAPAPQFSRLLSVELAPMGAGTYTLDDPTKTVMRVLLRNTDEYGVTFTHVAGGGEPTQVDKATVTLTDDGASSGRVQGRLEASLCSPIYPANECACPLEVLGVFDTTREPDGWQPGCNGVDATSAGGDVVCFDRDFVAHDLVVEAPAENPYGGDPAVAASVTSDGRLSLRMLSGFSGSLTEPPTDVAFSFDLSGAAPGTYRVETGSASFDHYTPATGAFQARADLAGAAGFVQLHRVDPAGGRVQGFFDVTLRPAGGCDCTTVIELRGSFDAEREPDDWQPM